MQTDISEFSYGFALTSELITKYKLIGFGAPEFPSLYKEGKKGGGYDMKLPGVPFYIQFKRSDELTRRNAKDAKTLGVPYYRFGIRPDKSSNQHQLLLELETEGNLVLYAAPIFRKPIQLDSHFSNSTVVENSIFIKPKSIGRLIDDNSHTLSFTKAGPAIFRSKPISIERSDMATEIKNIRTMDQEEIISRTIRDEIDKLAQYYAKEASNESSHRLKLLLTDSVITRMTPMAQLVYMARNLFSAEILFISK